MRVHVPCERMGVSVRYPGCWYRDSCVFGAVVWSAGGPGCVGPAAPHSGPRRRPHGSPASTSCCGLDTGLAAVCGGVGLGDIYI